MTASDSFRLESDGPTVESATDEFYRRNRGSSAVDAYINWPADVTCSIEDHNATTTLRVALLRIGRVRVRHDAVDMRLLLRSALEQLDEAERLDAEQGTS